MKKIILLLTGAVLLFAGCAKGQNEEVVTENGKRLVKLKATVENPWTRVSADIDMTSKEATFSWQMSDCISILLSDGSYTCASVADDNPGATATFDVWLDPDVSLGRYAYYPESSRYEGLAPDQFLLADDYLCYDPYKPGETFMPMLGELSANGAVFKAVGGVLKVHVTNIPPDAHFFELYVEGKQISGVFPITVVNDKKQITTEDSEYGNSILISFWDDNHEEEYATDFYIPLPCGTYNNLTFSLYEWEPADEYCLFSKTAHIPNGLEVERNDIIITPTLTVEIEKNTPNRIEIEEPYGYTLDENGVIHLDQYDTPVGMVARLYGKNEYKELEDMDENLISCELVNVTDPDHEDVEEIDFEYEVGSGVTMDFPTDNDGVFMLRVYYDKDGDNPLMAESCKFKVYEAKPLPETMKKYWYYAFSTISGWFSDYRLDRTEIDGKEYLKTYKASQRSEALPVRAFYSAIQGSGDGTFHAFKYFEKATVIPQEAFSDCSGLTEITLPDAVTAIGQYAFNYCSSLVSVNLPSNLESIGVGAFSNCTSLTQIELPGTVITISSEAFDECEKLTTVNIPESVTTIGSWAFGSCAIEYVSIPESVTSMGDRAFGYCSSLVYAIFKGSTPPTVSPRIDPVFDDGTTIYVPAGSESAYAAVFDNCNILTLPE